MTVKFSIGWANGIMIRTVFESKTSVQIVNFNELQPIHFGKNEEFTKKYIEFRRKIFNKIIDPIIDPRDRENIINIIKNFESKFTDEQRLLLEVSTIYD